MRPAFNLKHKYRVTMLTREEWTRGPGSPALVKGIIRFTDGSRTTKGTRAGVYGQAFKVFSRKHAAVYRLRYMPSWPVFLKFK
jgi:hypothetical protein